MKLLLIRVVRVTFTSGILTAYVNCQTDRGVVRQTTELTKDILLKENPTQSIMPVTVAIRHKNDQYEVRM